MPEAFDDFRLDPQIETATKIPRHTGDVSHAQRRAGGELNLQLQSKLREQVGDEVLQALENLRYSTISGSMNDVRRAADGLRVHLLNQRKKGLSTVVEYAEDILDAATSNPSLAPWSDELVQIRSDLRHHPEKRHSHVLLNRFRSVLNRFRSH